MSRPRSTSSTATCEALAHSTAPGSAQDELGDLSRDELVALAHQMLKLADETAGYLKLLESRCAGYRTVIQELQKQLAAHQPPSAGEELRHLLDAYGI